MGTDYRYLDNGNDDGTIFGQTSSEKIAFFGATPVVQPALTAATTTAVAIAVGPSVSGYGFATQAQCDNLIELVNLIRARLITIGLMSA